MFSPLRSAALCGLLLWSSISARAEILVKNGDKIAFLGDSITAGGWGSPVGYVRLVIAGLAANGVKAEPIPAGVGGHKSNQMLGRLQKDVLDKHPQWMTLSCGVNDVWHGKNGVPLDEKMEAAGMYDPAKPNEPEHGTYVANITSIIDQAIAAEVKPIILTATVINEQLDNDTNAKLAPYNDFLRKLAADRKLPLADLNTMFQEKIKAEAKPPAKLLTKDGVHMNPAGDRLMATGVLMAMGLDASQLQKAKEAWDQIPVPTPKPVATPVPATPAAAPVPAASAK